ncbi:hypothetical protein C1645_490043 [Glomus cerebriforme]|uniref:Uncharacterized protein n=1 Tax=Glomus cerebriforme TaxID=658196 RepID=A0A397SJ20_9GLOM|nr:hypothetical protein C1645_490043 [Glomus cerebriforme]
MDKAAQSELELQWNFIAGLAGYVALVKFKTSVYNAILPDDVSAIVGFRPNYHTTPKMESLINYFPFNNNPYGSGAVAPPGTTGYFSIAAGSFIQEQTSEQRSSTILGALGEAGGALGVAGGIAVLLFGESRLNPWGYAHKFLRQKSPNIFLIDDINLSDLDKAKSQITDLAANRSTLNHDDRTKLLEYELSEVKAVIKHYLLEE